MTDPAPDLRPLGAPDLDVVAALHALCFAEPWDRDALRTLLLAPGGFGFLVLDATSGIPGGFVLGRTAARECEVLSIGVSPANRKRGWGIILVRGLMLEASRRGAKTVVLEVAEDNIAAAALYRALGFVVVGLRRKYYRRADGAVDAHIMRLALDEGGAPSHDIHDQSVN